MNTGLKRKELCSCIADQSSWTRNRRMVAAPPTFVTGNLLSDTVSRKPEENGTRMLPGVFVAFLPDGNFPPNGVKFNWRTTPRNTQSDPANPDGNVCA